MSRRKRPKTEAPSGPIDAGPFDAGDAAQWITRMLRVVREGAEADVPCGQCNACCRAGMFVHVEPDETAALSRIPRALQFPAPGLPKGHVVVPHDQRGRCPMLRDDGCSIYAHRPRTCRQFDCRVFAATGIRPDGAHANDMRARVGSWVFDTANAESARRLAGARAAGTKIEHYHAAGLHTAEPFGAIAADATSRAAQALLAHEAFVEPERASAGVDDGTDTAPARDGDGDERR